MHWETSNRRAKMVEVVNNVIGKKPSKSKKLVQIVQETSNRSKLVQEIHLPAALRMAR